MMSGWKSLHTNKMGCNKDKQQHGKAARRQEATNLQSNHPLSLQGGEQNQPATSRGRMNTGMLRPLIPPWYNQKRSNATFSGLCIGFFFSLAPTPTAMREPSQETSRANLRYRLRQLEETCICFWNRHKVQQVGFTVFKLYGSAWMDTTEDIWELALSLCKRGT